MNRLADGARVYMGVLDSDGLGVSRCTLGNLIGDLRSVVMRNPDLQI